MTNYYSNSLNSSILQKCYEVAPPRVKQFLEAEIEFIQNRIKKGEIIIDLGCGYGRVAGRLPDSAAKIIGIDISSDNIELAKEIYKEKDNCEFFTMDAIDLKFNDNYFDVLLCVQNGISAFKLDPFKLLQESIRVTKKGGRILFSSYSEEFWKHRLEWFQIQADHGIVGEIDYDQTKNGIIVCKDGFKAITFSKQEFVNLASEFDVQTTIHEIDNSSVFCEMILN